MILSKEEFLEFICGENNYNKFDVVFKVLGKDSYKAIVKLKCPNNIPGLHNTIAILNVNNYYCVMEWQKGKNLDKPVDLSEEYRNFIATVLVNKENGENLVSTYIEKCRNNVIHEKKEKYFE